MILSGGRKADFAADRAKMLSYSVGVHERAEEVSAAQVCLPFDPKIDCRRRLPAKHVSSPDLTQRILPPQLGSSMSVPAHWLEVGAVFREKPSRARTSGLTGSTTSK